MPHGRYFVEELSQTEASIAGSELHHLVHVMRATVGDTIEVVDGKGHLATVTLTRLSKSSAHGSVQSFVEEPPPTYTLTLALALTKPSSMELAIEKATEIGVSAFLLFPADRSQKKEYSPHTVERLQTIIRSAVKQCGRLFMPTLDIVPSLADCLRRKSLYLYGALEHGMPAEHVQNSDITLIIGPESGFSHAELAYFTANEIRGLSLGPFILRAETAAIVGAALLQR